MAAKTTIAARQTKSCIYCSAIADTVDHVPPKCFLIKPYPDNLLTVPACRSCNASFSLDEEYLRHVLSTIGTSDYLQFLNSDEGAVGRAIARRPALFNRIVSNLEMVESGRIFLKPEYQRVNRLAIKIACGLYYLRYGVAKPLIEFKSDGFFAFNIHETRPPEVFMLTYTERFRPKKWTVVQDEAFQYIVVRNWMGGNLTMIINVHDTLWCSVNLPPVPHKSARSFKAIQTGKIQIDLFT